MRDGLSAHTTQVKDASGHVQLETLMLSDHLGPTAAITSQVKLNCFFVLILDQYGEWSEKIVNFC